MTILISKSTEKITKSEHSEGPWIQRRIIIHMKSLQGYRLHIGHDWFITSLDIIRLVPDETLGGYLGCLLPEGHSIIDLQRSR